MDYPFIQGISDIQQTQVMAGSRTTLPFSPRNHDFAQNNQLQSYLSHYTHNNRSMQYGQQQQAPSYVQLRDYAQKTLNSWGLKIGYLQQNKDNKMIVECLLQLIKQRFKDQQNRQQLKKSLSEASFHRNQYQSLLEQQRSNVSQKNKTIGRLQNTINELKNNMKKFEIISKKQRDQDKKMIAMLKSKNQQILHEIKKKQQQSSRIKQQMKKNVGQKGALKNVTFQVYAAFQKDVNDQPNDKIIALTQKYQNQRKLLLKQNLLIRQKLYDIREEIVDFAEWIDLNLFRQKNPNYKNKFVINHNLLFKKQSIVDEFNQIISDAKRGMKQLIDFCQEGQKSLQIKTQDRQKFIMSTKFYEQNQSPNKIPKESLGTRIKSRQSLPIMHKKSTFTTQNAKPKQKYIPPQPSINKLIKKQSKNQEQQIQLIQQSQISIISHISIKEILQQNVNFDKWDTILNNQ